MAMQTHTHTTKPNDLRYGGYGKQELNALNPLDALFHDERTKVDAAGCIPGCVEGFSKYFFGSRCFRLKLQIIAARWGGTSWS